MIFGFSFFSPQAQALPGSLPSKRKLPQYGSSFDLSAEKEGFEPPEPYGSTVFKTAAIDRSAISPLQK